MIELQFPWLNLLSVSYTLYFKKKKENNSINYFFQ